MSKNKKMPIEIWVEDDRVAVRCCHGEWVIGEKDERWLWVLNAIAFPEEHSIEIYDKRKGRQEHQKDMSCKIG